MRLDTPRRWPLFAFLYAAIVPFGGFFGPVYLARYLDSSLPGGEIVWMLVWAVGVLAGAVLLSARAPVAFTRLLPAMVAGVAASFGGIQLVVWRTQSLIAMFFGTFALILVFVGCLIGGERPEHDELAANELVGTGIIVVLAFVTALVNGAVYWFQDMPSVYRFASRFLLGASPVVGFAAVWRGELRLWVFLPLLATLPFISMVADIVTGPIALVFDLPAGGPLSFNAAAIDLAATVTVLVGLGAVLASGIRYVKLRE